MTKLDTLRDGDGKHFCRCLDLGRDEQRDQQSGQMKKFNYIVMSLVGRGLDGVVKEAGGRLSLGSAVGVSIQMLAALRGLHTVGYLHRDIKPGNSTIGRPESNEIRLLYLIDFGMARKYTKDDVSLTNALKKTNNFSLSPFSGEPTPPARCHQLPRKPTLRCDQRSSRTRIQPQGRHRIVVLLHDRALQRRTSMVQRGGDESGERMGGGGIIRILI